MAHSKVEAVKTGVTGLFTQMWAELRELIGGSQMSWAGDGRKKAPGRGVVREVSKS